LDALKILSLAGIPIKNIITKQYTDGKPLASSWYHPGQSGVLYLGKNILAEFGSIHPSILNDFEIEDNVFSFEIFIDHLPEIKNKAVTRKKFTLSQYQSVERDFAFIIDSNVGVEQILRKITSINKSLISSVELFDMYEGEKISKGKKSIAFSILLEPKDKTMNISEIEEISSKIIQTVEADFGAQLRNEKM
jgi:phenylalanyl-tRNA synthetase beta chain